MSLATSIHRFLQCFLHFPRVSGNRAATTEGTREPKFRKETLPSPHAQLLRSGSHRRESTKSTLRSPPDRDEETEHAVAGNKTVTSRVRKNCIANKSPRSRSRRNPDGALHLEDSRSER